MSAIRGEHNSWQVSLGRDGQDHIIAKCGSHTGHALRAVAFCDTAETAATLIGALKLLKDMHDRNEARGEDIDQAAIKSILEAAGLV